MVMSVPAYGTLIVADCSGCHVTAICCEVVCRLRGNGHIVQPFILGRARAKDVEELTCVSGRRAIVLDPWLYLQDIPLEVFWSACQGADTAVIQVPFEIGSPKLLNSPDWLCSRQLLCCFDAPWLVAFSQAEQLAAASKNMNAAVAKPTTAGHVFLLEMAPAAEGAFEDLIHSATTSPAAMRRLFHSATLFGSVALEQQSACALLDAPVAVHLAMDMAELKRHMDRAVPGKSVSVGAKEEGANVQPRLLAPDLGVGRRFGKHVRIAVATLPGTTGGQMAVNLLMLERLGCEMVPLAMDTATSLPSDVRGLYLTGVPTEAAIRMLSSNVSLRHAVAAFAAAGGVVYAEALGLALVAVSARVGHATYAMSGCLPLNVRFIPEAEAAGEQYVSVDIGDGCHLLGQAPDLRGCVDAALEVFREVPAGWGTGGGKGPGDDGCECLFHMQRCSEPQAHAAYPPEGGQPSAGPPFSASSCSCADASVPEGFCRGNTLATTARLAFASQPSALQRLVTACEAVQPAALAAARQDSLELGGTQPGAKSMPLSCKAGRTTVTGVEAVLSQSAPSTLRLPKLRSASSLSLDRPQPAADAALLPRSSLHVGCSAHKECMSSLPPTGSQMGRNSSSFVMSPTVSVRRGADRSQRSRSGSLGRPRGAAALGAPGCAQSWARRHGCVRVISAHDLNGCVKHVLRGSVETQDVSEASETASMAALDSPAVASGCGSVHDFGLTLSTGARRTAHGSTHSLASLEPGSPSHTHRPIASLAPSITDVVLAMGLGQRLAACTAACSHMHALEFDSPAPQVLCKMLPPRPTPPRTLCQRLFRPPVPPDHWRQAVDAIRSRHTAGASPMHTMQPSVLLGLEDPIVLAWAAEDADAGPVLAASEPCQPELLQGVTELDCNVLVVTITPPRTLPQMYDAVNSIGRVVGAESSAAELIKSIRQDFRSIATALPCPECRKRVLVLRSVQPILVAGGWVPELITLAGGECLESLAGDGLQEVTWEDVVALEPDVIVCLADGSALDTAAQDIALLAEQPGFWSLPATWFRDVYMLNAAHMLACGRRAVDALLAMAYILHGSTKLSELTLPANLQCPVSLKKMIMPYHQRCRPTTLHTFFRDITLVQAKRGKLMAVEGQKPETVSSLSDCCPEQM